MQFSDKQAYGYIAPANGYLKLGVAVKKRLDKMGKGGEKVSKGRKISLQELSTHRTPEDGNGLANFQSLHLEANDTAISYFVQLGCPIKAKYMMYPAGKIIQVRVLRIFLFVKLF